MKNKIGNPIQKTLAVMLSAVLLTGLLSGAAPVQSKAEEISSAATGTSVQLRQNRDDRSLLEEINPIIYTPVELEADATGAIPLPRELEEEILAGTTVEGIDVLDVTDYSLSASYDSNTQICTVSFALTELGKEKYFLPTGAIITANCRVKFKIAKKEITPLISVPQKMEFDATKGILSERDIEKEVLNKVSVSGIDLLKQSDYILGAVYDAKKSICTISFTLSSEGSEKYTLSENAGVTAECNIILRRRLQDAVSMKIEKDDSISDLKIVTEFQALSDAVLLEEEKEAAQTGTDISLVLNIRDGEKALSDSDKKTFNQALKEYQIGQYLDVSLFKVIGEKQYEIIKTAGSIRIAFKLPEDLIEKDKRTTREFVVLRLHEGQMSVLQDMDTDPTSVTVDTDRFSAYAIAYKDITETGSTGNDDQVKSPDKTDGNTENTNIKENTGNVESTVDVENTGKSGTTENKENADSKEKTDNKKNTGNTINSGNNGKKTSSDVSDYNRNGGDDAPETGDNTPLEFYATITMISGFSYVLLLFKSGRCGMTDQKKKELVSRIVRWACKGGQFRRGTAYAAIVLLLVYYHSIGKKTSMKYEKDLPFRI